MSGSTTSAASPSPRFFCVGESASSLAEIENLTVSARKLLTGCPRLARGRQLALTPSWWYATFTPCVQP